MSKLLVGIAVVLFAIAIVRAMHNYIDSEDLVLAWLGSIAFALMVISLFMPC